MDMTVLKKSKENLLALLSKNQVLIVLIRFQLHKTYQQMLLRTRVPSPK